MPLDQLKWASRDVIQQLIPLSMTHPTVKMCFLALQQKASLKLDITHKQRDSTFVN